MGRMWRVNWILGLGLAVLGLAVGLSASGLWPKAPLHATATDRFEKFAVATGFVEEGVEAVFILDHLTGELQAAVLGRYTPPTFQARFRTNVLDDLNRVLAAQKAVAGGATRPPTGAAGAPAPAALITGKDARFMMVTGVNDFRQQRTGQVQYSSGVIYVFEAETGVLLTYAIPWNRAVYNAGRPQPAGALIPLEPLRIRAQQM